MDILSHVDGDVVRDDVRNGRDVDTASDEIGADQPAVRREREKKESQQRKVSGALTFLRRGRQEAKARKFRSGRQTHRSTFPSLNSLSTFALSPPLPPCPPKSDEYALTTSGFQVLSPARGTYASSKNRTSETRRAADSTDLVKQRTLREAVEANLEE